ncbi:Maf family protein [Pseudomarimonas salicorniae]|uniref:7-methyl-GTP pyrophosphatase n=1 Tax=Pseudomarimonas salicorniae TaxID=2933270 RepID=A0ABT0GL95_9GAMM|nr:nucleoside triphosphate pyrophosphatase [Lysobacter sp. CAU 1642]MCK7594822.1 Maf family nucleotide pyrophosphatase [Lysobacter sp. CAU 1642]
MNEAPQHPPLILASTSSYRRELLQRLRLPFRCERPQVEEAQQANETVESMVARLARAKAAEVASRHPEALVIGSDQAASLGGRALGKPGGRDRAIEQLMQCSGRPVEFHTAVCLLGPGGLEFAAMDTTRVRFRTLEAEAIARYVEAEQPFDCAGSFKCEGLGICLFEGLDSEDPTALVGLPLIALCKLLRRAGVELP